MLSREKVSHPYSDCLNCTESFSHPRYPFYRTCLLQRLRQVLVFHQDLPIRELSAESIKRILSDSPDEVSQAMLEEVERLKTVNESRVAHGSLLLLLSLSRTCYSPELKAQVWEHYTVKYISKADNPFS